MIPEFFAWYGQRMAELLPSGIWPGQDRPSEALVVDIASAGRFALSQRRQGTESRLGEWSFSDDAGAILPLRARNGVVILRLCGSSLLERETVLPLAAERDVDRVLSFELDRLTPFASAEVCWTAATVGRDPSAGTIRVRISLVVRSLIEPFLAAAAGIGLVPTLLEATSPDGTTRVIPLGEHHFGAGASRDRRMSVLHFGCAILALIAAALPFLKQSTELASVETRIEEFKPGVTLADALRRRIASDPSGLDVVAAEHTRTGETLSILVALTDILPDDTSLSSLSLRQRRLTLDGQSRDAARLIGLLSSDPTVRNAAFASPVTKIDGGMDTFSIRAEIVQ